MAARRIGGKRSGKRAEGRCRSKLLECRAPADVDHYWFSVWAQGLQYDPVVDIAIDDVQIMDHELWRLERSHLSTACRSCSHDLGMKGLESRTGIENVANEANEFVTWGVVTVLDQRHVDPAVAGDSS